MRADVWLRGQELWRRNRQGTLPSPAWWPADLAPLFWPALIVLLVAVLASALTVVLRVWPQAPDPVERSVPAAVVDDAPEPQPLQAPISEPPAVAPPLEEIVQEPTEEATPELEATALEREDLEPEGFEPEGLEGPFAPDPLVELVQRPEADGLLLQAEGIAEQSLLILRVRPAFPALSAQEQRRRAELWQQWALELGYDHLELRDSRAGLIARDALVGEGMIVLRDSSST